MADRYSTAELIALVRKHKVAFAIGGGVLLVLAASGGGQTGGGGVSDSGGSSSGGFSSSSSTGGVDSSGGTDSSGGFDKGAWDNAQAKDDWDQRNRIEVIRGVEKCRLPDGTVIEVESGTCNP